MNTTFLRKVTVVLVAIFFASCDKDYNTLGSDIVGNDNFTITPELFTVKAYNQKVPGVQTNNLSVNQLGVMHNDIFGTTKSNYVTQLSLAIVKPTFKSNVVIDSVILTVPYYSTKINTGSDGRGVYTLNSIHTTNTTENTYDPINLKVFRNGFYLRDSDPATATVQKHFSNEGAKFNSNIVGSELNNSPDTKENTAFVPNAKEYKKYKVVNNIVTTEVESRNSPRMRLHLDKAYFYNNIIQASAADLDNNNAFKSYFKGLYFEVDAVGNKGTSMVLDFAKGDVTIYYKQDVINNDTAPNPTQEMASLTLNMTGNTVNLFDVSGNTSIPSVNTPNYTDGDKNLYLKGGQGSMSFLELFAGNELAELKAKNVLVNEASLTFTVDKTGMTGDYKKPQRIYIFNADTNVPIYDYYLDGSVNRSAIGGIIETVGTSTTKDKYKIRITEHINNILKETTGVTKNVRLGVVVTGDIGMITSGVLNNPANLTNPSETDAPSSADPNKKMTKFLFSSIMSPLGTVLYGSNYLSTDANYDNRIKFEIYYTKPN
jgi:hypothetical protein